MKEGDYRKTIDLAYKYRSPVFLNCEGIDITFESCIRMYDGNSIILENSVHPDYIRKFTQAKRFSVQINMLRFESDEIHSNGKEIIFPLKYDDSFENSRSAERYSFSKEEQVYCKLRNPFDQVTFIKKKIVDLSNTGLCLKSQSSTSLFQPGVQFSYLTVDIDGATFLQTSGTVIYVRKMMNKHGKLEEQIGIKFDKEIHQIEKIKPALSSGRNI
ncbi:MAG: PilZ domain-containing protein [Oligoflexales bacterium]|nr:PilZ domain-containing protein [Oligoflexales bacterium]